MMLQLPIFFLVSSATKHHESYSPATVMCNGVKIGQVLTKIPSGSELRAFQTLSTLSDVEEVATCMKLRGISEFAIDFDPDGTSAQLFDVGSLMALVVANAEN